MRDLLTGLAAALLIALGALWIAPAYMDWQSWRGPIETALSRAAGMPVRSTGPIRLTLLPRPSLALSGIKLGESQATHLTAETLELELGLTPLLRGDMQFRQIRLIGVDATLAAAADGRLIWPGETSEPAASAFDRIEFMRARLRVTRGGREIATLAPLALEASAPARRGPWRLSGESGGTSFRIATGEAGAEGLRLRLNLTSPDMPILDSEGLISPVAGLLTYAGSWQLRRSGDPATEGQIAGRIVLDPDSLGLPEVTLEWGPMEGLLITNRLAGALSLPLTGEEPGLLKLTSRRLDLGPLTRPILPPQMHWLGPGALPRPIRIAFDAEQILLGGEELSRVQMAGQLSRQGLAVDDVSGRFAGLDWRAAGQVSDGGAALDLSLNSQETGRLALALARLGLEAPLADVVGAQGRIEASGGVRLAAGQITLPGWRGVSGGANWAFDAERSDTGTTVRLEADNLRLDGLPALSGAAGLNGTATIALTRARIGATSGDVRARIERDSAGLRIRHLSATGFGGLTLEGAGEIGRPGAALSLRLAAPDAVPALTLLSPLMPEAAAPRFRRQSALLSPVALTGTITEETVGRSVAASGQLGGMAVTLRGEMARDGTIRQAALRLDKASTDQLARLAGLPAPQRSLAGTRLELNRDGDIITGRLVGTGLSVTASGPWRDRSELTLTVAAATADLLLPAPVAQLVGAAQPLAGGALATHDPAQGWRLNRLKAADAAAAQASDITLSPGGHLAGQLHLPHLSAENLLAAGLQADVLRDASGRWSTRRFEGVGSSLTADIGISADRFTFTTDPSGSPATARLTLTPDEMRLDGIETRLDGAPVTGSLRMSRSSGLGSLSADLAFGTAQAGWPIPGLSGRAFGRVRLGGSGETPAQIIGSLGGQGQIEAEGLVVSGLDPGALASVIDENRDDLLDRGQMETALGRALARNALRLRPLAVPVGITAGTARISLPPMLVQGMRLDGTAQMDLRNLSLDARLRISQTERPRGWSGDLPQLALRWSGPIASPARQIDAGALVNGLAQRRLQQEMDRLEAFNADLRERSFFARRLRAERDMATRQSLPENQPPPAGTAAPPLPPPLQITPVPVPRPAP